MLGARVVSEGSQPALLKGEDKRTRRAIEKARNCCTGACYKALSCLFNCLITGDSQRNNGYPKPDVEEALGMSPKVPIRETTLFLYI